MKLTRFTAFIFGVIVTAISVSAVSYINTLNAPGDLLPTGFTPRNVCGANGKTLCAVGVQGPGGGTVFYVDTTNEMPEYDYLEVAPTIAEFAFGPSGPWSTDTPKCGTTINLTCDGHTLENDSFALRTIGIGTGRAATVEIVARHEAGGVAKNLYAAGVADTYATATASDWWLPSKDEMNEFCKVVKATGQPIGVKIQCSGGLRETNEPHAFWSSSEPAIHDYKSAWFQDFDDGGQQDALKTNALYVRPVRGF